MKKHIILFILLFAFGLCAQAQYKIIVNNSNTATSLTRTEASNYFLKRRTKWKTGIRVTPVDLSSKSDVRKAFTKAVHKKTISQVRSFWQQSVFSGKATPPSEKANDIAVINYVKTNKGAIGYVSDKAKITGVKTITIK